MKELRFSYCNEPSDVLDILKPFNADRPATAQVQLHLMPWDNYKQELTAMALYSQGADISQVGGPLVNDLIAMKALRPFTKGEVDSLGGTSAFSQVAWENSRRKSEGLIYAIPWTIDPRAIIYWRDMLEKAGVDESTAFTSFDQMEDTFRRLQESGVKSPWLLWMEKLSALQNACTWIWGAGGEIGNDNQMLILHAKALLGLRNYFGLFRYMGKNEHQSNLSSDYVAAFTKQRAAVTIGNLSHYHFIKQSVTPAMQKRLGVAIAPGPLFVGSSSLVVWKGTRDETDAVNLVQYMLSEEAQRNYCLRVGFLPARVSLYEEPPFSTEPYLRVFAQAALNGRTIANFKLGGLLEDLLANAFSRIWAKIFANPDLDLDAAIRQELEPIVLRASFWSD